MRLAVALASVVVLFLGTARGDVLDEVAAKPPATGALVVRVLPDGPTERAGVQPGDVITRYAGAAVTGQEDLVAAIEAQAQATGKLDLTYVRRGGGGPVTVQLPPGKIGVTVVGVQEGKPLQLRPPATGATFDFAAYKAAPRDEWYAYRSSRGEHTGFQHDRVEVKGDQLVVTTELALDGPAGPRHYLVVITTTAEPKPKLVEARYEAPLDRASVCTLTPRGDGKLAARISQDGKVSTRTLDLPADALHENLSLQWAAAMPMQPGACLHYRTMGLFGDTTDPSAMCVGEPGEVEVDGKKVPAVPVTVFSLAKKVRTSWVDPATRTVLKFEYPNGTTSVRTTREQALAGVNPKLKPRT